MYPGVYTDNTAATNYDNANNDRQSIIVSIGS